VTETVKTGQNKAMAPYPASVASQAVLWPWPWISPAQCNKLLEIYKKPDYHILTFYRLDRFVLKGGCSPKAPPFSNKKAPEFRGSFILIISRSCQRILKIFDPANQA